MKILYSAMGSSLQMFLDLHQELMTTHGFPRPAFYVSNSENYLAALKNYSELGSFASLHEWDIINEGKKQKPDPQQLEVYEEHFGPLWHALLADRRLIFGRLCKVKQDYKTHFSHEQLMGIIMTLLDHLLAFIKETKPDAIIIFSPVTAGDYLMEVIAKKLNIPFLCLRSTKIENRLTFADSAITIPDSLAKLVTSGAPFADDLRTKAEEVINQTRAKGMNYEGVISYGPDFFLKQLKNAPRAIAVALKRKLHYLRSPIMRNDNHLPPPVASAYYTSLVQPIRAALALKSIPYVRQQELATLGPYTFYPLHFEPEMAVQVLGHGYQNQIDVIRNLALSVPINMKVLVKEHPRSFGVRPISYYRKLLDIPNVVLAHPFTPAHAIIRHASLVTVISGAIGFETLVAEKPVLVFGTSPLTLLPKTMVRHAAIPAKLADDIRLAQANYSYDQEALIRYICATLQDSIPIDLYSILLQKNRRETTMSQDKLHSAKEGQIRSLAAHLAQHIKATHFKDIEILDS